MDTFSQKNLKKFQQKILQKTPQNIDTEEEEKKANVISNYRLTMLPIMVTMLPIMVTLRKTMNRHMQQIDHQTGEVVEGFVAYVVPKRKNGFQKGWMAMAQEAMMMLAQSNLTGNDMKVMWAMLARLDYENLIQVNQAEVAEQVGMNRHHVNRSIKKLIELGVVLEGVKIGISRSYRLNPNFGWKGSAKGHREALHEHLKVVK